MTNGDGRNLSPFCEQNAKEITAPAAPGCHASAKGALSVPAHSPGQEKLPCDRKPRPHAACQFPAVAVVAAAAAGPATLPSLGQQLRECCRRGACTRSPCADHEANVLWLSEGALGPDEHGVVVEALEVLAADTSSPCHEKSLEDGRHALVFCRCARRAAISWASP